MPIDMDQLLGAKMECVSPLFLSLIALTVAAFLWRLSTRRLVRGEWIVLALPAIATLLIMVQHLADGYGWLTFWRYHYPAWLTLLVYPAYGLAWICRCLPILRYVLLATVLCFFGNRVRHAVVHAQDPERHTEAAIAACEQWAADRIRADWDGMAHGEYLLDLSTYATSRLPTVFAPFPKVAYLCGGRDVQPARIVQGLDPIPDYCLAVNGNLDLWNFFYKDVSLRPISSCRHKKFTFTLYRTVK